MSLIPLSRLLVDGRPDGYTVALRQRNPMGFGRFRSDVMDAAARFKAYKRAALICQDSYNFAVGLYGLLHAGATVVFPPNSQKGTLEELRGEIDFLVDDTDIENNQGRTAGLDPIDPTKSKLIFLTSGTTGKPKKILKNLAMLEREIGVLNTLWGSASVAGPVYATVSHQHIYGMTFKLLWPLMAGHTFVSEMYGLWENLLADLTSGSTIVSSPAHLGRLNGLKPLAAGQMPQKIFSAGAPLSLEANQKAIEIFGHPATEIFGSTETGAFATRRQTNAEEPWHLLPGIQMRCDVVGGLEIRSPFVGEGWIETSDLIEPVTGGFYFLGRADRIAKIEGKRISLIQVERSLEHLPLIKNAAVIVLPGSPDCLVAAIVPSLEGRERLEEVGHFRFGRLLRSHLATMHEAAGIPRLWRFLDELPLQGMGKRREADILSLFKEGV